MADVGVRDPAGHWQGVSAWSAEEREALWLGVRARIVDVLGVQQAEMGR